MKHFQLLVLVFAVAAGVMPVAAQNKQHGQQRPDKKEWMAKMREAKHNFLAKELQLTDAQKKEFFVIYDKNEDARRRVEHESRQLERAIEQKGDAATDAELDAVINDQFSLEERLSKIDRETLPQMRKVLTRRQLARLKHAERKFNRTLMEHRNANFPPSSK